MRGGLCTKNVLLMGVAIFSMLLSSCAQIKTTKAAAAKTIENTDHLAALGKQDESLLTFGKTPYLGNDLFKITKKSSEPKVFSKKITLVAKQSQSLNTLLDELTVLSGIEIELTHNAIDFLTGAASSSHGAQGGTKTLKSLSDIKYTPNFDRVRFVDALSQVVRSANLFWRFNEERNQIELYRTTSKTYHLALNSGSVQSISKVNSGASNKDVSGSNTTVSFDSSKIDPWAELIKSVQSMGSDIKVSSLTSRGLLLVTGTPDELSDVDQYIKQVNATSGHGVMLKLYVYNIKVNKGSNYGLNWDAIYKSTKGSLSWSNANMSTGSGAGIAQIASITAKALSGPFSGSSLVVNALQNDTDATRVTGGTIFSVNGMPTPLSDVRRLTYVSQVNVTTLGGNNSASNNVERSVEPGVLQVGYVFNVTPEIVSNNKVLIHLSVDMSKINDIKDYQTGDANNPSKIELPDLSYKKLIQTLTLNNGQTAVISGFGDTTNDVGTSSIGDKAHWWLGGDQSTNHERTMTVLIITPYIMGDDDVS